MHQPLDLWEEEAWLVLELIFVRVIFAVVVARALACVWWWCAFADFCPFISYSGVYMNVQISFVFADIIRHVTTPTHLTFFERWCSNQKCR